MRSLVLVCVIFINVTSQNITLIKDYLNYSHIQTALVVTCENVNEMFKIVTELHNTNSWSNVWSVRHESVISTLNYTQFFVRLEHPHTVVVNLDCENVKSFLNQSSQRMLFHLERTWLIFSNNVSQAYDILQHENINLDADITLVIPMDNELINENLLILIRLLKFLILVKSK